MPHYRRAAYFLQDIDYSSCYNVVKQINGPEKPIIGQARLLRRLVGIKEQPMKARRTSICGADLFEKYEKLTFQVVNRKLMKSNPGIHLEHFDLSFQEEKYSLRNTSWANLKPNEHFLKGKVEIVFALQNGRR